MSIKGCNLTLSACHESVRSICQAVSSFANEAGMRGRDLFLVELAVDEACTNIVEYGYSGCDSGDLIVECSVKSSGADRTLLIKLTDHGNVHDPTKQNDLTEGLDDLRVGGLGVQIMRKAMDSMEYQRTEDSNLLILSKRFTVPMDPE
ncbi:MAG: ATP-binding protein [Chloroflexota bacterium]